MKIGHVHLKIRNMEKSVAFYQKYLCLKITERLEDALVFMSAGEMHHEPALQAVGKTAAAPRHQDVGLYHVAFEVSDRKALNLVYQRLKEDGVPVNPVDHRISWALYFSDPDGNGIEVYWTPGAQSMALLSGRGSIVPSQKSNSAKKYSFSQVEDKEGISRCPDRRRTADSDVGVFKGTLFDDSHTLATAIAATLSQ